MASKWINGQHSLGQKYRRRIGQVQKTLYSWWKEEKITSPISKIDDSVKHVNREHNQETDKGYWDGSFKDKVKVDVVQ